eukprot:2148091-Pyramimonas_sp.AAC.1
MLMASELLRVTEQSRGHPQKDRVDSSKANYYANALRQTLPNPQASRCHRMSDSVYDDITNFLRVDSF